MTVNELMKTLEKIVEVHPEAQEATVWMKGRKYHISFPVEFMGYDTKHKPKRLVLQD